MEQVKRAIRKYRKSISPPYGLVDFPYVFATLFVLVSIPLVTVAVTETQGPTSFTVESDPVSASGRVEFVSNELLVKLKKPVARKVNDKKAPGNVGVTSIEKINKTLNVVDIEQVIPDSEKSKKGRDVLDWFEVTLPGKSEAIEGEYNRETGEIKSDDPDAKKLQTAIDLFKKDPNVIAVEPNFTVNILATPNDPYYFSSGTWGQSYADLYGIKKINPTGAWDQTTGSASITVAVIDTGVDRNHEDLQGNMWVNTAENPNNGRDDDGNGYIDDYYGWDWVNNDNDPMDDHGHGTHTAGTIAAVGNNGSGVVGVNWTSKIMALKFLSSRGSGTLSSAIKALEYAADMGAQVSSNSWGCACQSTFLDDAVTYEHDNGMVIVAASGNSNRDALDYSPASSDRVITVGATDANDARAWFSNFGEKIDVVAPGVDILSTRASINPMCSASRTVGVRYCRVSGTSMSTPHVAGLAALLLAKDSTLTNEEIRQIIRGGSDDIGAAGKDRNFGYGRINAGGSMNLISTQVLAPIITSPKSRRAVAGSVNIVGSVPGNNFSSYKIESGSGRALTSWRLHKTSSTQIINGILATVDTTKLFNGRTIFRLTVIDTGGKNYQFQIHDVNINNSGGEPPDTSPPTTPTSLRARVRSTSRVDLSWLSSTDNKGVAGYRIYRNNSLIKRVTRTNYADTTVRGGKTYTYYVRAYDAADNLSPKSGNARVTTPSGAPLRKLGDLNGDNRINIFDLSILLVRWKSSSAVADLNGDGKVNILDLSILLYRWGR